MPGALDARLSAVAQELVDTYGKPITLQSTVTGVYDPSTGSSAPTVTSFSVNGVIRNPSLQELTLGEVQNGDLMVTFAARSNVPAPGLNDQLLIDSMAYRVLGVKVTYSGALPCTYVAHVRS